MTLRTPAAILAGAVAVAVYLDQAYSGVLRPQAARPLLLDQAIHLGLVALIAFLVGYVVRRRGWLAAGAAYLVGIALWVLIDLRPSPPWVPTDVGGTWEAVFLRAIFGGSLSAVAGAAGCWAARRRRRGSAV